MSRVYGPCPNRIHLGSDCGCVREPPLRVAEGHTEPATECAACHPPARPDLREPGTPRGTIAFYGLPDAPSAIDQITEEIARDDDRANRVFGPGPKLFEWEVSPL